MSTNITTFLDDLDAGVFGQKLGQALSDVAAGVIDHNSSGKVTVTFDMKQIGGSHQVAIKHRLSYTKPTKRGKMSEENTTETPMYVGKGGSLTLFPENQNQLFDKHGNANA